MCSRQDEFTLDVLVVPQISQSYFVRDKKLMFSQINMSFVDQCASDLKFVTFQIIMSLCIYVC